MGPVTARREELADLATMEEQLVAHWRSVAERQPADFVAALIVGAHDFDPRLGEVMERCQSPTCNRFVLESLRNAEGWLYCPDGCEDDAAHAAEERRNAALAPTFVQPDPWPVIQP